MTVAQALEKTQDTSSLHCLLKFGRNLDCPGCVIFPNLYLYFVTDLSSNLTASSLMPGTISVQMYNGTLVQMRSQPPVIKIERVQTGIRMEKRLLKVLKALAELRDMSLGDLLEGVVLHAFEGKAPFSSQTLKEIKQLKAIYGLTLQASDSHHLKEHHESNS